MQLSLRNRLLVFTMMMFCIIAVAIGLVTKVMVSQAVDRAVDRTSSRTNELLDRSLENFQRQLSRDAALLADRPGTRNVYQADEKSIVDHLNEVKRLVGIDWLMITGSDGRVLGSNGPVGLRAGKDMSSNVGIQSAIRGTSWTGLAKFEAGHINVIAVQPIRVGAYVQATLTLGLRVDDNFARNMARVAGVEVALVEGKDLVASSVANVRIHSGLDHQSIAIGSKRFVGRLTPLKTEGSGLLQSLGLVEESGITAPFESLFRGLLITLGGSMLVALLASIKIANGLTGPIQGLVQAARVIQSGDWPMPFHSRRADEIGILQNSFDQMTDSVRQGRERLVAMLEIDPLTELWNHRTFRERLDAAVIDAVDSQSDLALAIIDIDGMEKLNQDRGTTAGDLVLVDIAQILTAMAEDPRLLARNGGNEFAIVIREAEPILFAELLRKTIFEKLGVSVSIGLSRISEATHRPDLLLLAAETAVGQAKEGGRNRVREFEGFRLSGNEDELRQFLQQGSYAAVRALAEAVDAKDEYTRGHSQRVADYARALASALNLDPGFVELVYTTGTLHDVGKIGVPDSVLKKPAPLTDEEFSQIKLHPELGEKIVSQIPQLADTLPGIRHHHERWDGRGYPDGLSGEDIPLIARILAVADTYDAMTSDRPYRKGMPIEKALGILESEIGTQFEPELVRIFSQWAREQKIEAA